METESKPPSVKVDIAPYGTLEVYAPEAQPDGLLFLERNWPELWPVIRGKLEDRCTRLGIRKELEQPDWVGAIPRLEPGVFMADKAELLLSLSIGEKSPEWDFFLTGITVIHFQPVY